MTRADVLSYRGNASRCTKQNTRSFSPPHSQPPIAGFILTFRRSHPRKQPEEGCFKQKKILL